MLALVQRLNRPVVAVLAVTAIAGFLRIAGLSNPKDLVFDEAYYPKAGCILIGGSNKYCRIDSSDERYWRENKWDVGSWVHPPLGKWAIGLGIKAFGMNPFGWRIASAVAGTLVVTFTAITAWLLFGSVLWTFAAGLLIATENLSVVMSRLGLLDVHVQFWVTLGFLCLVLDKRWIERRTPPLPEPTEEDPDPTVPRVPSPVWRPWRLAAGVAMGAACAVKWSGVTALAAAILLSYMWETSRRMHGDVGRARALGRAVLFESFGVVLFLAIVPVLTYVTSWLPWFHHFDLHLFREPGVALKSWWEDQSAMWRYHIHDLKEFAKDPATGSLTPTHPYYSRWWSWLPMLRPVSMYVKDLGPDIRQILAIGNPALFWGALWALPYAVWAWWRRHDWVAGFLVVAFAVQYFAWFPVDRPEFFFYILPMTPLLGLAVTYLLRDLSEATIVLRRPGGEFVESMRHPYRPIAWAVVVGAVAVFLWFLPVVMGLRISDAQWHVIVWFPGWV